MGGREGDVERGRHVRRLKGGRGQRTRRGEERWMGREDDRGRRREEKEGREGIETRRGKWKGMMVEKKE